MLKITVTDTPNEQMWILQGRLAGLCVTELRSMWLNNRESRRGRQCTVDLNDVTFIDEDGEGALSEMMREGARLVARGVYTGQLLEDLRARKRRRMCRFLGRLWTLALILLSGSLHARTGTSQGESAVAASVSNIIAPQSPCLGSVPEGEATDTAIPLSIGDALERGLRFNGCHSLRVSDEETAQTCDRRGALSQESSKSA